MYLLWSHEHHAWWGQGRAGYVRRVSAAGRYTREEAVEICADAIPGTAQRYGALPELPVRLSDIDEIRGRFREEFPDLPPEPWE